MAKTMTLETLAAMTADAFRSVDKRFDGVEQRLGSVEQRLDGVEKRLGTVASAVREGFAAVLQELRVLNDSVKQARGASNVGDAALWEKIEALERDVQKIKRKVKV